MGDNRFYFSKVYKIAAIAVSAVLVPFLAYLRFCAGMPSRYNLMLSIGMIVACITMVCTIRLFAITKDKHNFPDLIKIQLYNSEGALIKMKASCYDVSGKVKIKVFFRGNVHAICVFLTPKGEQRQEFRRQIGCIDVEEENPVRFLGRRTAELTWEVVQEEYDGCLGIALIGEEQGWYMSKIINIKREAGINGGLHYAEQ